MRRGIIPLVILALLVGVWRIDSGSTNAQTGTPAIVGAWKVTLTLPGLPPIRTLSSYSADGLVSISAPISRPAPPGGKAKVWFTTPAYGVWQDAGNGSYSVAASNTVSDENGLPVGFQTIAATVHVADDGTLQGQTTSTLIDPSGKTVQSTTGTLVGQRIAVEPAGAATPTA